MTYKRKYKPSHTLWSLYDFEECDSEWYEIAKSGRKMWHRSALESLQTRTLMNWIYGGDVIACVKADEIFAERNRGIRERRSLMEILGSLPTIEIVHCRDCKYWQVGNMDLGIDCHTYPDHFCAEGERKEK